MNKKYQNGFFLFGLLVLIIMASQLDFGQAWQGIQHAGYWFVLVLVLWAFLYMMNTASWYLIINTIGNEQGVCRKCKVGFWWLYKITIKHLKHPEVFCGNNRINLPTLDDQNIP